MISRAICLAFPAAAQTLADHAEEINKLNVFPVPDGDTGTNMSLTLQTVVKEIQALPEDASMEQVAQAITHGSLMGARGNSGVITSQILRGIAEGLKDAKNQDEASAQDIAAAFRNGVKVAFKAVRKPVEGTILTVLRDVSREADRLEKQNPDVMEMLDALVIEAYQSVARTPELLPVLKENGVVDSGAFGFATFLEGFVNALSGKSTLTQIDTHVTSDAAKGAVSAKVEIELNDDWEGSEYRYCNEFLFHADDPNFNADSTLEYLATLGDCELVVGDFPEYKVHVHSNEPNRVLEYMLKYGQVYNVFIHNMDLEAHERTEKIAADKISAEESAPELKDMGVVAVCAGTGSAEILRSLGVDVVIEGGQTMNPSTADILAGIEQTHARNVIVLPNNSNIRMAAEAAASAAEGAHVRVVATKSVLQAFAALFQYDPDMELDELAESMLEAAQEIRDGEVTTAVRDSQAYDGTPIHAGDVMGIADGKIMVVGSDVLQVTLDLIALMQKEEEGDTLTILAGQDLDDVAFENLCSEIGASFEDLEIDEHRGEQPLYPVIFSIE